jgi:linoleoyl-CoA desaturase
MQEIVARPLRPDGGDFRSPDATEFQAFGELLRARFEAYFQHRGASPKGDSTMAVKIIAGFGLFLLLQACLYAPGVSAVTFCLLYFLQGLCQLFLLLNVGHDSNHNAVSQRFLPNALLSRVMDLFGINSRMWRILHHAAHHSCINIHGRDEAIFARGLIRLSPEAPLRPIHRYQAWYAFPLYAFFSLDYIFIKDIEYHFVAPNEVVGRFSHNFRQIAAMLAWKLFYLGYMIALPVLLGGWPLWLVLLAFFSTHLFIGLAAVIVFQTSHVVEGNDFPAAPGQYGSHVRHVLATTADYATASPLVTFLVGGLNHHAVHHLCPHVCHTHYPALTAVLREASAEFRMPYRQHSTLRQALSEHFRLLQRLASDAQ